VEVDVPPAPALALPDARLLVAGRHHEALRVLALVEAHVGDDGHVPHDADVRRAHRGVVVPRRPTQPKEEAVELEPFDELAEGFRLEGGERSVGEFLVGGPVALGDAFEQALVELKQLVFCGVRHGRSFHGGLPRMRQSPGVAWLYGRQARGESGTPVAFLSCRHRTSQGQGEHVAALARAGTALGDWASARNNEL
jgi:hypothetical protein